MNTKTITWTTFTSNTSNISRSMEASGSQWGGVWKVIGNYFIKKKKRRKKILDHSDVLPFYDFMWIENVSLYNHELFE